MQHKLPSHWGATILGCSVVGHVTASGSIRSLTLLSNCLRQMVQGHNLANTPT
jgi:hypothetical protein